MKHIRTFEGFSVKRKLNDSIKESVMVLNDTYRVKTLVDIKRSMINSVVNSVKSKTGQDLRQFYSDADIAEEIVKFANMGIDAEKIPSNVFVGGAQAQAQAQGGELPIEPQAQTEAPVQAQPQVQVQTEAQPAPQAQVEAQPQVQVQTEAQPQAQPQGEFEEVQGTPEDEEENPEEEEELPL